MGALLSRTEVQGEKLLRHNANIEKVGVEKNHCHQRFCSAPMQKAHN